MGYELTRFIGIIDEEFQCHICKSILKNPIQTPCDHSFCTECILNWVLINAVCPVDREPLTTADFRPPSRLLRNLLGKLNIKCDFHDVGCNDIIKLDNLETHRSICIYNLDEEVTCDKICKLKMSRREYQANDCHGHFENLVNCLQTEILTLKKEMHLQSSEKLNDEKEMTRLAVENKNLNGRNTSLLTCLEQARLTVKIEQEENRKLNDKVIQKLLEIKQLNDKISQQCDSLNKLTIELGLASFRISQASFRVTQCNSLKVSYNLPPNWQRYENMRTSLVTPNVLETSGIPYNSLAMRAYCLEPLHPYFRIRVVDCSYKIRMGLASKENILPFPPVKPIGTFVEAQEKYTFNLKGERSECSPGKFAWIGDSWSKGDVITCGIKFPIFAFTKKALLDVEIYFHKNGVKIKTFSMKMPRSGFFPTIEIHDTFRATSKVEYLSD